MTSCSSAPEACSDRPSVGIATLTTVTSSKAMNWPHSSTMSISQRPRSGATPAATAVSEVAVMKPRLPPARAARREPADAGAASNRHKASVDVELVALGVLHPHRVVIEAVGIEVVGAQGAGDRGPEIGQPPGLGVDSLLAGGERDVPVHRRAATAGVDVEVEAVLDHLGRRLDPEPDAGALAAGIDDAVGADSQLTVGQPDVTPPVVPGREAFRGRLKHVSQGSRPEAGQRFRVRAVDDKLESDSHRALRSAQR